MFVKKKYKYALKDIFRIEKSSVDLIRKNKECIALKSILTLVLPLQ